MGVRVILTTGGTGGHIFPALAVAEQLRREGAELLFVGSQYGSEAKLAKQAGLEFRGLPVRGVLGRGLRSVGALWGLFRAVFMARAIVKDFRPDAVIGFGAYASFPSLVAAKLSGVPIAVHEQNAMPGLTNRMLAKLAKRVFLSLPDVTGAFDAKKSQLTGNPVREAIVESGKNAVGHPGTRRLLVMGGSQGAQAINDALRSALPRLTRSFDIIHLCGKGKKDASIAEPGYVQYEYISKELPDLFAAADIILSRAGANAIFEFLALAKPALLIPLPLSASRGDQILNAGYFARKGYAMTLDQAVLTPDTLFDSIHDLYNRRLSFISAMSGDSTADGTDEVLDVIRSESEGSKR